MASNSDRTASSAETQSTPPSLAPSQSQQNTEFIDSQPLAHRVSASGILRIPSTKPYAIADSSSSLLGNRLSVSSESVAVKRPSARSSVFVNGGPNTPESNGPKPMQRSSTVGVRKSMAIQIPSNFSSEQTKSNTAASNFFRQSTGPIQIHESSALSASVVDEPINFVEKAASSHRLSIANSRSMTQANPNMIHSPAPNHFYQQQQQMLNPNYRRVLPSPTATATPLAQSAPQLPSPLPTPQSPPITPPQQSQQQQQQQQPPANPSLKLPLTPEITIRYYRELLTSHELEEIHQFRHIYFAGAAGVDKIGTARRRTGAVGLSSNTLTKDDLNGIFNHGYDDSRGDYYFTHHDHIGYRYECISILGKGSFGQVAKCFDHKTKSIVALKIIRNKKRFEKQGAVEVKILDRLRREDEDNTHNLVHMLDNFHFRGHLCITFELLGTNLYDWVKTGGFRGIHSGVLKTFTVQILECLTLLHKIKAVHCDLKPENILLCDPGFIQPQKCDVIPSSSTGLPRSFIDPDFNQHNPLYDIKVIDFGSACYENERIYTYVQSRFYRSPEVILGINYNMAIDMWSLGCILAELYTGYPLFPGENEQEQLACIMEIKGCPPEYIIERGTRKKLFFENGAPRSFTNSKGKKRRPGTKTLSSVLRTTDVLFLDFLGQCLDWDAERRIKPEEALRHEWLVGFAPVVTTPTPKSGSASPQPTRQTFGEIMSNAAISIVNRRRENSVNAEARSKKTASAAAPDNNTEGSWKASFSNWRRMSLSVRRKSVSAKEASKATTPDRANAVAPPQTTVTGVALAAAAPAAERGSIPQPSISRAASIKPLQAKETSESLASSTPVNITTSHGRVYDLIVQPQQFQQPVGAALNTCSPEKMLEVEDGAENSSSSVPVNVTAGSKTISSVENGPPPVSRSLSISNRLGGLVRRSLSLKKKKSVEGV